MKQLEDMLFAPRVIVQEKSQDGFCGEIHMAKWTGSIVVSWGCGWEHVSVSPYKRNVIPSWDDMCYIKDLFWDEDECVVQYHPPKSQYVNMVPNCLHLWKPVGHDLEMPPSILSGIRNGQSLESVLKEIAAIE